MVPVTPLMLDRTGSRLPGRCFIRILRARKLTKRLVTVPELLLSGPNGSPWLGRLILMIVMIPVGLRWQASRLTWVFGLITVSGCCPGGWAALQQTLRTLLRLTDR